MGPGPGACLPSCWLLRHQPLRGPSLFAVVGQPPSWRLASRARSKIAVVPFDSSLLRNFGWWWRQGHTATLPGACQSATLSSRSRADTVADFFLPFLKKISHLDSEKFNVVFKPFARRHCLWCQGNNLTFLFFSFPFPFLTFNHHDLTLYILAQFTISLVKFRRKKP
jgi:ABC-type transport system involved in multi-copper enzyme maturation permease subunit